MPTSLTCTADGRGRITLPKGFANATVIVQQINESEVRIRLASDGSGGELQFVEELSTPLSNVDRDQFLDLLESPPEPNAALSNAMFENVNWIDEEYMESCDSDSDPTIRLEDVRSALSKIPGSMDSAIDESRGEW